MKKDLVVLYIRISIADGDIAEKGESNSVANQKLLLHQYLDAHPDLADYPRFEAVDDGFSGTNGNRPMLQKVLSMAEQGDVKAIVVKDMSRFFRNYYESAKYLDMNFPSWNVRFLSVTENFDSDELQGNLGGIEQGLKHIINAYYPKMISKATTTAQVQLKKQGKFIACQPPYGYKKHSTELRKLAINEDTAPVVRLIFDMALERKTVPQITRYLNDNHIETSTEYNYRINPNNQRFRKGSSKCMWSTSMVGRIVKNYTYTGALVSRKRKVVTVGSPKTVPCEPIIVEGTHEGIVTLEEYEQAQTVLNRQTKPKAPTTPKKYPLKSLVRCGYCKRNMIRASRTGNRYVYFCRQQEVSNESQCLKNFTITEDVLEDVVLREVEEYTSQLDEGISFSLKDSKYDLDNGLLQEIKHLKAKIKEQKYKKRNDYEKYTGNKLSKEDFLEMKQQADSLIVQLEQEVLSKENQVAEMISVHQYENGSLGQDKERQSTFDILTEELTQRYVKAVYIYDMNRIEVEFHSK